MSLGGPIAGTGPTPSGNRNPDAAQEAPPVPRGGTGGSPAIGRERRPGNE